MSHRGKILTLVAFLILILVIYIFLIVTSAESSSLIQTYSKLIEKIHPNIPKDRSHNLAREIIRQSRLFDVPHEIIMAMAWKESRFINRQSEIKTTDGKEQSCGYGQIHVDTARDLLNEKVTCEWLITNWRKNIRLMVRYFSSMAHRTGHLAGAIGRYNGRRNLDYVHDVLELRERVISYRGG